MTSMDRTINPGIAMLKPVGLQYELAYGLARFRVRFGYEKSRGKRTVNVKMLGQRKSMKYTGLNRFQRPGLRMALVAVEWFLWDSGLKL